jgi:hypothetical protein
MVAGFPISFPKVRGTQPEERARTKLSLNQREPRQIGPSREGPFFCRGGFGVAFRGSFFDPKIIETKGEVR